MSNGGLKTWHKLAALLIVVMAIAYVALFMGGNLTKYLPLPSGGSTSGSEARNAALLADLKLRHQEYQQRLQKLSRANAIATWFYPAGTDANKVQKDIESIAFKTGLNYSILRSIAATGEKSDYFRTEEVNISGTVEIKTLMDFMREVEAHKPLLRWSTCTISPRQQANAQNTVFVAGRIRAYVLTDEAAATLRGEVAP